MKKSILRVMAMTLAMVLILATFASCGQQGEQGPEGPQGEQGIQGEPGVNGTNGVDGKSAYELAVDKGYTGTVEEWLVSLVGEVGATGQAGTNGLSAYEIAVKNGYTGTETEWLASLVGAAGANGSNGSNGTNGTKGKSAYELACENGFEGSLSEWLDSLVGKDGMNGTNGTNGKSAYELAVENGFDGSVTEWLASLVGATGKDGTNGSNGANGENGKSAYELAVEKGYDGDLQTWLASLVGAKGDDGKSAYEIAVDNGYEGTEEEWLASLVGEKGDDGLSAFEIYQKYHPEYTGTEEEWIESLKGADGEKGEQGVSVVNAYINSEMHLILVLSNNIEIDAGYVGVTTTEPAPTTYTVTFVDYNGVELKVETVESGKSATAPADPIREGYAFVGWDKEFNNITGDLTVTAQYEVVENKSPMFIVESVTTSSSEYVVVNISIKNNPGILGMSLNVSVDDSVMTFTSAEKGNVLPSFTLTSPGTSATSSPYSFIFDAMDITAADKEDGVIISIMFKVKDNAESGVYNINLSYVDGDIFDSNFDHVDVEVTNGTITIK